MGSGTLIVTMLVFMTLVSLGVGVLVVRALRPAEETTNATEVQPDSCLAQRERPSPDGGQMPARTINPYQPNANDTHHLVDSGSKSSA